LRDKLDQETREGRAIVAAQKAKEALEAAQSSSPPKIDTMPGSGRVLGAPSATEPEDEGEDGSRMKED